MTNHKMSEVKPRQAKQGREAVVPHHLSLVKYYREILHEGIEGLLVHVRFPTHCTVTLVNVGVLLTLDSGRTPSYVLISIFRGKKKKTWDV